MIRRTHLILAALLLPTMAFAGPSKVEEAKESIKVLLVPPVSLGQLPRLSERRIVKALQDVLQSSARLVLVTDKDQAIKASAPTEKHKAFQTKGTATARRIDEADLLRQEGTDLAAEGKHQEALGRLHTAITAYEKSFLELVDYTKLADAYARAGLEAFATGSSHGEVTRLFELGIAIQPTLVIDRRKQPKELLELFDSAHDRMEKAPRLAIAVEGPAALEGRAPGAELFVDGVKVGPLPAKKSGLLQGTHYIQLRGEAWQPWGQIVKLKGKDMTVQAKPTATKVAAATAPEVQLKVEMLAQCAQLGAYVTDVCKKLAVRLSKQTGAEFLVFTAIKVDRYGRLALHPFVMEGAAGATVALEPVELAQDLNDLQQKATRLEQAVAAATHPFSKARALTKQPTVYKEGAK